jgi:hypothetical protein
LAIPTRSEKVDPAAHFTVLTISVYLNSRPRT